jgi:hypothetical protein
MTPELRQAIYDCVPSQSDERVEQYLFNQILGQITNVDRFMKLNHSDIRHKIADQFILSKTARLNRGQIAQTIKTANDSIDHAEMSRGQENNFIKQVGALLQDNIYMVTMSIQDEKNRSHINQQKLDAVSKNENKRYDARKFDYVIYNRYHTQQFAVVLIENLDEASTYLIILIDLTTGKIYCGRRYANLNTVVSDGGELNLRAVRKKIIYNENSLAQHELFKVAIQKINQFRDLVNQNNISDLFDLLGIDHNHGERAHSDINKIGKADRQKLQRSE